MPNTPNETSLSALEAVDAYLQSIVGDPDAALERLTGKTDRDSVKRMLSILIDKGRANDAACVIQNLEPDEAWVDRAVLALVLTDQRAEALRLTEWAKQNAETATWHRCILANVEGAYKNALKRIETERHVNPESVTEAEREQLRSVAKSAKPILDMVKARGRIDNELESLVLQHVAHAQSLLREVNEATEISELLYLRKPVPHIISQLILARVVPPQSGIVERLRSEHPDDFRASLHAALIEGELLARPLQAWEAARKLTEKAKRLEDQLEVCRVLLQLSQSLTKEYLDRTKEIAQSLLPAENPFHVQIQTLIALNAGDLDAALALLESNKDLADPHWLQAYAAYLKVTNQPKEAISYLKRAAEIFPHPEIFRTLAAQAFEEKQYDSCRSALERLASITPGGREVFHNLALVYVELQDWRNAAKQFLSLRQLEPTNALHTLNAASALTQAGEVEEALRLYSDVCAGASTPLEAHIAFAKLLKITGQGKRSVQHLLSVKQSNWHRPEFLLAFLEIAFAAGEEADAHEAMLQLRRLQLSGKVGSDIIQEGSFADLKEHIQRQTANADELSRLVCQGRMPWLMADSWLGQRSPYWSWRLRTQEMNWVLEDLTFTSQRCVYATNSFAVRPIDDRREIDRLHCPLARTPIAIDVSALITLHRLNLLTAAAEYFGKVSYPASYHALWLTEKEELIPSQLSRVSSIRALRSAIDAKRILVSQGEPTDHGPLPVVCEHKNPDEGRTHYRISDVLEVLRREGLVSEAEAGKISAVAHNPPQPIDSTQRLTAAGTVIFDVLTLHTLHQVGALEAVLKAFTVVMSEGDHDDLVRESSTLAALEETKSWQDDLVTTVRKSDRFVELLAPARSDWENDGQRVDVEAFLSSAFLAIKESLPLLADDRVCQALVLNQRPKDPFAAFGTDCLIEALAENQIITWEEATDAYVRLMTLRYRFIFVPTKAIDTIFRKYRDQVPGEQMRLLSRYTHDCMRDPGLLGGVEPTTVPTTIATKSFYGFLSSACEAVGRAWADEEAFSVDQAQNLTKWVIRELLPSPPRILGPFGAIACRMSEHVIITTIALQLLPVRDFKRGRDCFECLQGSLGLSDDEMQKQCGEVINAF